MPSGTGLITFGQTYPERLFDVGIAEEHAVSMAGGLDKQGMTTVVALYSTFLQRSFDQIQQDVSMLNLHTVFAVDRAGLVGEDGETHHGVFDVGFLRQMPGMKILCPCCCEELENMLTWAVKTEKGPVAVRYPRGGDRSYTQSDWDGTNMVKVHKEGANVAVVTYGTLLENAMDAAALLSEQGIDAGVIRLLSVHQVPEQQLTDALQKYETIVIVEEAATGSGIREKVAWMLSREGNNHRVFGLDLGQEYVTHGNVNALYAHHGLDANSIAKYVKEVLKVEN
jgi:1-deoxy-D-xylulose-5-phosphate synthase